MSLVLIALHGRRFSRSALNAAFNYCRDMKFKVNVLLVDGGEEPQPVLMDFLARLKQAGMNGHLDRQAGPLGRAVQRHASLYKDIRLILVDSMKHWGTGVSLGTLTQPVGLLSGVAA